MVYVILFVCEIVLTFFLSKEVQKSLSYSLYRLTRSKTLSIYIMSLLFLPGTFIHEISHFLAALFLLVPVDNLQLIPKIEEESVRLGSVTIGKTDPIRRFIIGTAPLTAGVLIIFSIFSYYPFSRLISSWFISLAIVYIIFTISNSMFSSKRDMEGLWAFIFVFAFFSIILWFLGIRIDISSFVLKFSEIIKSAAIFLTAPIIIDILILLIFRRYEKR